MSRTRALAAAATTAVTASTVAACSVTGTAAESEPVTILAAASLAGVMPELVRASEERHPDRDYEVSYAGSSAIVQQLNAGAPADAVVLAGETPLTGLDSSVDRGRVRIVATNTLAVTLARENPGEVKALEDLARKDVTVVLCAEQVPCGQAAQQVFERADLAVNVASYEPDVRATLSKVTSGEADAALVYVTDAATTDLPVLELPADVDVRNRYPAFSVNGSVAGGELVSELRSASSRALWREAGFGLP